MRQSIARGATVLAAAAAVSLAGAPGASAMSGQDTMPASAFTDPDTLPDYDAIQGKYSGFTGYEIGCAIAQSLDYKVCMELGNVSPVKAFQDANDLAGDAKKIKRH